MGIDKEIQALKDLMLREYNTTFKFSHNSAQDYKSFAKGKRQDILALIYKQAKKGALFPPNGSANQLHPPLHGFAKIKNLQLNIRIIYRPVVGKNDLICMEILAIGPRDKEIYEAAEERLEKFYAEFGK